MLVLERTLDSTIRIGSDIRIKIVDIPGRRRVRLGLEVPGGTLIWREELGTPSELRPAIPDKPHLNVLVVEDDANHARLIEKGFQRAGAVTTRTAHDAEAALALLTTTNGNGNSNGNGPPNLVILDLQLPHMSGYDLLKKIREHEHLESLPVIMLSGVATDSDVSACLDAGANAFLAKTDDYHDFCELVIRIAEFWRHHRG